MVGFKTLIHVCKHFFLLIFSTFSPILISFALAHAVFFKIISIVISRPYVIIIWNQKSRFMFSKQDLQRIQTNHVYKYEVIRYKVTVGIYQVNL
jgi:hypothetical protein